MKIAKAPISMETPIEDDDDSAPGRLHRGHQQHRADRSRDGRRACATWSKDILDSLTPREAEVLRMRFGIEMSTDHTLEEVGKRASTSPRSVRIRQIEGEGDQEAQAVRAVLDKLRTLSRHALSAGRSATSGSRREAGTPLLLAAAGINFRIRCAAQPSRHDPRSTIAPCSSPICAATHVDVRNARQRRRHDRGHGQRRHPRPGRRRARRQGRGRRSATGSWRCSRDSSSSVARRLETTCTTRWPPRRRPRRHRGRADRPAGAAAAAGGSRPRRGGGNVGRSSSATRPQCGGPAPRSRRSDNETLATQGVVDGIDELGALALSPQLRPDTAVAHRPRRAGARIRLLRSTVRCFGDTAPTAYGDMPPRRRSSRRAFAWSGSI